jgi:non-ribosomal peptide synthetase-like protein
LTYSAIGFAGAFLLLSVLAWRRYAWVAEQPAGQENKSQYSLSEVFGEDHLVNVPHQKGVRWLSEIFGRSAARFPDLAALQIPHTGESFTFAEFDARAEAVAAALSSFLTGPDQVVAVAVPQDDWRAVACHLGILKAGGTVLFLDNTLPEALLAHMLNDARPVVVLTRGEEKFHHLPALDVTTFPQEAVRITEPSWLDDPTQRLAAIFYTGGTTGMPKGVECPHAGYVNLALSYADYFDLIPGMDATSLTSSLGYDGSISEMYSAWISGCAVVLLTKEEIRSGPDLIPILRQAEVTVLFCPPVLLTTLTANPEIDLPYPLCRYIVPAGEAFPSALVEPWTRARRQIINTYGPTEASTDTSRQTLRPGEPVTIGSPFPNVSYVILEPDGLQPLLHGEVGELCIGGVHVARGYRNLPEQTAQKFFIHPQFGRLYRTGDKCKIEIQTQRVHFLGRIDAQLKVRGHRVEVQPVEDILQTQFPEIEAAVLDYQNETLVAFVAAPSISEGAISEIGQAPAAWAERVRVTLARQLPAPSVPTRIFLVENFVMKPVSGKIDRTCLPSLSDGLFEHQDQAEHSGASAHAAVQVQVATTGPVEISPECEEVLSICRAVFEARLGPDDDFAEAGGHSLLIARLAQQLQSAGWVVSVRALLSGCNTARKVASRPRTREQPCRASRPVLQELQQEVVESGKAPQELLPVGSFTALQVLFATVLYAPGVAILIAGLSFADFDTFFAAPAVSKFILAGCFLYLLGLVAPFGMLLWVMVIKLCMGGHLYKNNVSPGLYRKWSKMHLRIWCIGRMQDTVLVMLRLMYRSAPLMAFVLRQLGGSVGANLQCAQDAHFSGPLDFLAIGNDVAIQTGAYVQAASWREKYLHVGPVRLESGCKIGMRAAVASGVTVGRGSWITPFTPILASVGSHEMWQGAPACLSGRCTELSRTARSYRRASSRWIIEALNLAMQITVTLLLIIVPTAVISWLAAGLIPAADIARSGEHLSPNLVPEIVWSVSCYAFVTTGLTIAVTSVLLCLFIRATAVSAGIYPSGGLGAALLLYRMKLMNLIQTVWTWTVTGQYLRALAGMRFPRVGGSECDLMFNLIPELATADSRVFWSNSCFTNMLDYGAQHVTLRQLDMPRNFFSGNNAVAEYGHFPSNFILGTSSPGNDIEFRRQMCARLGAPVAVAGNPAVKFARSSAEKDNEAYRAPGILLFLARVFMFDLLSICVLPIAEVLVFAILYLGLLFLGAPLIGAAGMALVLTEVNLVLLCVGIKKSLVGNKWGADDAAPFWSWQHFAYFFAQDCFFVWCRASFGFFAGTILSNSILRWMGCRIGERTILTEPMQCSDWNAVSFGADCVFDGVLQLHTFEGMILKVKQTSIGDGCVVSSGATVMGGAVLDPRATASPLALVLKEVNLGSGAYEGSPAEPVSAPSPGAANA